jgi:hypothetical protein
LPGEKLIELETIILYNTLIRPILTLKQVAKEMENYTKNKEEIC